MTGDGLLTGNQRAEAQVASRPNFVVVMTDDLDERSMEDLSGIRTVMGSKGTTFENAYVTLCAALVEAPSSGASMPTTTA
jgi:hypothetical protein